MGKSIQNSRVRERLLRQVNESRNGSRAPSQAELLTKKPNEDSEAEHNMPSDTDIWVRKFNSIIIKSHINFILQIIIRLLSVFLF